MNEDNRNEPCGMECEYEPPSGVPTWLTVMLAVLLCVMLGYHFILPSVPDQAPKTAEANAQKAQAEAQKASIEFNDRLEQRLAELRMSIAKQCADKGNIPVLIAGNVDCRVLKQ